MKKITLLITTLLLNGCTSESNLIKKTSNELGNENNALFTIRNIQSGYMINNTLNQQGRETKGWEIIPVRTPEELLITDQSGWIMIRNPGTDQCLGTPDGYNLIKMDCNTPEKMTLFSFIPSTTGAVQIKIIYSGFCLTDSLNGGLSFETGKCIADLTKPSEIIPQRNLWMLNPQNTPSPVM